MLALDEKQHLIQALGRLMFEEMSNALRPLVERIERMENVLGNLPVPQDGKDGKDGKDADPNILTEFGALIKEMPQTMQQWTRDYVRGALDALPKPEPIVRAMVDASFERLSVGCKLEIDRQIEALPKAKDGVDGKDGANGANGADGQSLSLDDVREHIDLVVREAVADLPVPRHVTGGFIDRDGALSHTFSDGSVSNLGPVVGKDGADCDMEMVARIIENHIARIEKPKDGKDGLSVDNFSVSFDLERRTLYFRLEDAAHTKESEVVLPVMLYRELWKEGETYRRGDTVTRDGSMFVCIDEETNKMPGTSNSGWRLSVKRGRDGKDGKEGKQGEQGEKGRDGRDLTQRGPDGSKWG